MFWVVVAVSSVLILASIVKLLSSGKDGKLDSPSAEWPLTSVEVVNDRLDLGPVPSDTVVFHEVLLVNSGTDSLRVEFVDPDCNCTGYTLTPCSVAATGDSLRLTLEVDMHKKQIGKFMLNTVVGMNTEKHLHRIVILGDVIKQ